MNSKCFIYFSICTCMYMKYLKEGPIRSVYCKCTSSSVQRYLSCLSLLDSMSKEALQPAFLQLNLLMLVLSRLILGCLGVLGVRGVLGDRAPLWRGDCGGLCDWLLIWCLDLDLSGVSILNCSETSSETDKTFEVEDVAFLLLFLQG